YLLAYQVQVELAHAMLQCCRFKRPTIDNCFSFRGMRTRESQCLLRDRRVAVRSLRTSGKRQPHMAVRVDSIFHRASLPLGLELGLVVITLELAAVERCNLRRLWTIHSELGHALLDILSALRERHHLLA